jgi:hypothetical protein
MKGGDTITITRESSGSTGYGDRLVTLENLALVGIATDPAPGLPASGGTAHKHFTFVAIKAGTGKIQFASFRPWELPAALFEQVLPINAEAANEELAAATANFKAGGFTPFAQPDDNARAVFKEAFAHLTGADCEPLPAATQAVAGLNCIFVANAKHMVPGALAHPALIRVYKPLQGPAKIVKITSLGSPHRSGSGFTADYVSTRLAAGMNYRFAGTQTLSTKEGEKFPVLFTVCQPLTGAPVLTAIQKAYDLV